MMTSVRIDEEFHCDQQTLWDSLTDADQLSAWLGGPCGIEPRVGGAVTIEAPGDGIVATGTVRSFEPPRSGRSVAMIEHTFVDGAAPALVSVCRWSVIAGDGGTSRLLFTHDGAGELWQPRLHRVTTPRDTAADLLRAARTIVLVSFIGPEVPKTLLERGFSVVARTGPHDDDWARCALGADGDLVTEKIPPPSHADLVHLDWEPDGFVDLSSRLGARTLWYHSARTRPPEPHDDRGTWVPAPESARLRGLVERSGMTYVDDHYIADIARSL